MKTSIPFEGVLVATLTTILFLYSANTTYASWKEEKKDKELEALQKRFEWWPTDAQPGPLK
ncbi:MAG: hypothetical protein KJ957_04080, partial [Candidatus Omnitrophica bacterium]|nr:hypothetical protein [Candidatus Omnitrophota bacterium]